MSKLELLKQAAASRGLAVRGRMLAAEFTHPEDQARLKQYVEELEGKAIRLEAEAAALD
jgi:hypothetical protein